MQSGDLGEDIDVDWVDERRSEPVCPHSDTTLHHYNLLRFFIYNYTTTSSSVQRVVLNTEKNRKSPKTTENCQLNNQTITANKSN